MPASISAPSLVAVAMGSTLIREGVDLAMTALSDVSAADRAAAAASLAASAGPMLQPDQIIRAEADHMLLDPRTTDAGAVLDQRDRALRACGPGVTLPRCATLLRADLPVYDVTLHRYLEARSAIFHLGRALHTPG